MISDPELYEQIDDKGNLFKELSPSISDARLIDSKDILINQNTSNIVYSLVVSSLLLFSVAIY
jgi:hypothetical protein